MVLEYFCFSFNILLEIVFIAVVFFISKGSDFIAVSFKDFFKYSIVVHNADGFSAEKNIIK